MKNIRTIAYNAYTLRVYDYKHEFFNNKWVLNGSRVVDTLYISENATNKDICRYLYSIKIISTCDMRKLRVQKTYDFISIYQKKCDVLLCSLTIK